MLQELAPTDDDEEADTLELLSSVSKAPQARTRPGSPAPTAGRSPSPAAKADSLAQKVREDARLLSSLLNPLRVGLRLSQQGGRRRVGVCTSIHVFPRAPCMLGVGTPTGHGVPLFFPRFVSLPLPLPTPTCLLGFLRRRLSRPGTLHRHRLSLPPKPPGPPLTPPSAPH